MFHIKEGFDYVKPSFLLKVVVFKGHQKLSSLLLFQYKHESFYNI